MKKIGIIEKIAKILHFCLYSFFIKYLIKALCIFDKISLAS